MKRWSLRYGVAALAVGVGKVITLLRHSLTAQDTPFVLVFGPIMVGAPITDYFFLYPKRAFSGLRLEMIDVAAFALDGVPAIVLTSSLRSARNKAEESALEALRFCAGARSASC